MYFLPLTIPSKRRLCTFPGCDKLHDSKGFCVGHLRQFERGIELRPLVRTGRQVPAVVGEVRQRRLGPSIKLPSHPLANKDGWLPLSRMSGNRILFLFYRQQIFR